MSTILNIPITVFGQDLPEGISIPVGSTVKFDYTIQDPNTLLPLNITGMSLVSSLSEIDLSDHPKQPPLIARQATITDAVNGLAYVPWASGDTVPLTGPLSAGAYYLDLWITDGSGNRLAMLVGGLIELKPAATLPSNPVTPLPSEPPLGQGPQGPAGPTGPQGPIGPPIPGGTPDGATVTKTSGVAAWQRRVFDIRDYGDWGDPTINNSPILQALLNDLIAAKRGARGVGFSRRRDGSRAVARLDTPVIVDSSLSQGSSDGFYTLECDGGIILPNVGSAGTNGDVNNGGANNSTIRFDNFNWIDIHDMQLVGTYPGFNDTSPVATCDIGLFFNGSNWHLYGCSILGVFCATDLTLPNYKTPRAPICSIGSEGSWDGLVMAGSGPASVIFIDDWGLISGFRSRYTDFYDFESNIYAPTGPAQVLLIGNPHDAQAFTNKPVTIMDWMNDEGAGVGILARPPQYPAGNLIEHIEVNGFRILGNASNGSTAFEFDKCGKVTLRRGKILRGGIGSKLFNTTGVQEMTLDGVTTDSTISGAVSDGGLVTARNVNLTDGTPWGRTLIGCGADIVIVDQNGARSLPVLANPRPAANATSVVVDAPYVDTATNKIIRSDGTSWYDAMGNTPP
jgi:hypothetical protein